MLAKKLNTSGNSHQTDWIQQIFDEAKNGRQQLTIEKGMQRTTILQ